MSTRYFINGLGRLGITIAQAIFQRETINGDDVNLIAVNDKYHYGKEILYLLKHNSNRVPGVMFSPIKEVNSYLYSKYSNNFYIDESNEYTDGDGYPAGYCIIKMPNGASLYIYHETDFAVLPLGILSIDIVLDCTGVDAVIGDAYYEKYLWAGATRVIACSHPNIAHAGYPVLSMNIGTLEVSSFNSMYKNENIFICPPAEILGASAVLQTLNNHYGLNSASVVAIKPTTNAIFG